jgi:hypothetical protein
MTALPNYGLAPWEGDHSWSSEFHGKRIGSYRARLLTGLAGPTRIAAILTALYTPITYLIETPPSPQTVVAPWSC